MTQRLSFNLSGNRLALLSLLLLLVSGPQAVHGQPTDANQVSIQGLVGVTKANRGDVVQIYTVELEDAAPGLPVLPYLGLVGTNLGIQITLSDLTTPTNITAADITQLQLYRSNDATFGGDILIDTQPAAIGSVIEFDATGAGLANRLLPGPGPIYFIITAQISTTAQFGTAFRVGALPGHIGITETGLGGNSAVMGALIAAMDANHVVIGDVATSFNGPVSIPFGGETAMLLLLLSSGIYAVRRI